MDSSVFHIPRPILTQCFKSRSSVNGPWTPSRRAGTAECNANRHKYSIVITSQYLVVVTSNWTVLKVRHPGGHRCGWPWFGYRGCAACHQLRYAKDHRGGPMSQIARWFRWLMITSFEFLHAMNFHFTFAFKLGLKRWIINCVTKDPCKIQNDANMIWLTIWNMAEQHGKNIVSLIQLQTTDLQTHGKSYNFCGQYCKTHWLVGTTSDVKCGKHIAGIVWSLEYSSQTNCLEMFHGLCSPFQLDAMFPMQALKPQLFHSNRWSSAHQLSSCKVFQ